MESSGLAPSRMGPMRRPSSCSPRRLAFALAALTVASAAEGASTTRSLEYATTGTIGTAGLTGPAVVRFEGVADAFAATPSPFPRGDIPSVLPAGSGSALALGQFDVASPTGSGATIYAHTPFAITFRVISVGGELPTAGQDAVTISGWLDGTVGGDRPSQLTAHYRLAGSFGTPWEPRDMVGSFQTGNLTQTLTIPGVTTILACPGGGVAAAPVSSLLVSDAPPSAPLLDPNSIPEPGPLVTLLVAAAGGVIGGRRGRGRPTPRNPE